MPKLWRLEHASTDDPEFCAQEWSNEGELEKVNPRQFGGIGGEEPLRRQTDGLGVSLRGTKDCRSLPLFECGFRDKDEGVSMPFVTLSLNSVVFELKKW